MDELEKKIKNEVWVKDFS